VTPASDDPEAQAHDLIERVATLLEVPREPTEPPSAEALHLLYGALTGVLEASLIQAMKDVLTLLRQASMPLGPMGTEWLARQERAIKREDP
jgi:hypothetical protein